MTIPSDLVAEAAAVSLVLFVGLVLCVPLVLAMIGTVEGQEARPLEAAVTWMRVYRARHGRRGRRSRAQWDIQLAHAGGRYEELPSVGAYGEPAADAEWYRELAGQDLQVRTEASALGESGAKPVTLAPVASPPGVLEPARTSIFDRLSDTDCFAAINWDIHRAVNELAVLQRDLWAKYRLPAWSPYKWRHRP